MTYQQFLLSIQKENPPEVSKYLLSLWYDKQGNWNKAHNIAQDIPDTEGSWIHGYLHREEGDTWNANYWYSRAGRKMPDVSLTEEWESLVQYFLDN